MHILNILQNVSPKKTLIFFPAFLILTTSLVHEMFGIDEQISAVFMEIITPITNRLSLQTVTPAVVVKLIWVQFLTKL